MAIFRRRRFQLTPPFAPANSMPAIWDVANYSRLQTSIFGVVVLLGLQLLAVLVPFVCDRIVSGRIEIKGSHHDVLDTKDKCFIAFNKFSTCFFMYHLLYVTARHKTVWWQLEDASLCVCLFGKDFFVFPSSHALLLNAGSTR